MAWLGKTYADGSKVVEVSETRKEARINATFYNRKHNGKKYSVRQLTKGLWGVTSKSA